MMFFTIQYTQLKKDSHRNTQRRQLGLVHRSSPGLAGTPNLVFLLILCSASSFPLKRGLSHTKWSSYTCRKITLYHYTKYTHNEKIANKDFNTWDIQSVPSAANFELNDVILVLRSNYRQNSKVQSCINEVHILS